MGCRILSCRASRVVAGGQADAAPMAGTASEGGIRAARRFWVSHTNAPVAWDMVDMVVVAGMGEVVDVEGQVVPVVVLPSRLRKTN